MSRDQLNELPEWLPKNRAMQVSGWSQNKYYEIINTVEGLAAKLPGYKTRRVNKRKLFEILQVNLP